MHILQGDYSGLFRTHQQSLRRKQRLSKERKEDCQDEATGSAPETEAVQDCTVLGYILLEQCSLFCIHSCLNHVRIRPLVFQFIFILREVLSVMADLAWDRGVHVVDHNTFKTNESKHKPCMQMTVNTQSYTVYTQIEEIRLSSFRPTN